MPQYTYSIGPDGPVVPIMVGLDSHSSGLLAQAGIAIAAPLHDSGILDTGSDVTVVSAHLLRPYQLLPGGGASTTTTGGALQVRLFRISLSIVPPVPGSGPLLTQAQLVIAEMVQAIPNIDVIVGRDVLDSNEFHCDGPRQLIRIIF